MPQGLDFNTIMMLRKASGSKAQGPTKKKKSSPTSETLTRRYSALGGKSKSAGKTAPSRTIQKQSLSKFNVPQDASGTPVQDGGEQQYTIRKGPMVPARPQPSPAMFIHKLPPHIAQLAAKYGRL